MIKTALKIIALLISVVFVGCGSMNSNSEVKSNDSSISTGTNQFIWEDTVRLDDYYGGSRIVNVRLWYPSGTTSAQGVRTPYLLFADSLYNNLEGWSDRDYKSAQEVELNSYVDAPVDGELNKAPLLIFSPSLGGNLSYYTYYAEYFAKKGYIVMGINHLYESEVVIDKLGSIHQANHSFQDSIKSLKIPEEISAERYRELSGERQKVLAEDIVFALNQVLDDPFIGDKIDAHRIAVFGHSIGGSAAIYSSLLDDRIKAVIDLDGTPPSVALSQGIDVPFMFIEDLSDYKNHDGYAKMHQRRNDFCELNRADAWRVLVGGIGHDSFLDVNYYFAENPRAAESEKESLDLFLSYMSEFLDFYLLGNTPLSLNATVTKELEIIRFEK